MRIACQYAIVRFLPFLETGEFANVGVVLFAPKKGYWGSKLAPDTFPRVTQFFGEIDRKVYRTAMQGFNQEMLEIQRLAGELYGKELLEFGREVTRLRESLLRFGELRTLLGNSQASCCTLIRNDQRRADRSLRFGRAGKNII